MSWRSIVNMLLVVSIVSFFAASFNSAHSEIGVLQVDKNSDPIQALPVEAITLSLLQEYPQEFLDGNILTRGKISAASIFKGLAQICISLGQLFASQKNKNKKENIIELLGTIFTVAADITGPSHSQQSSVSQPLQQLQTPPMSMLTQEQKDELTTKIIQTTDALFELLDCCNIKKLRSLPKLLASVKSHKNQADRHTAIKTLLTAKEKNKTQKFIQELFSVINECFKACTEEITECFKQIYSTAVIPSSNPGTLDNHGADAHSGTRAILCQPPSEDISSQHYFDALWLYCLDDLVGKSGQGASANAVVDAIAQRVQAVYR